MSTNCADDGCAAKVLCGHRINIKARVPFQLRLVVEMVDGGCGRHFVRGSSKMTRKDGRQWT